MSSLNQTREKVLDILCATTERLIVHLLFERYMLQNSTGGENKRVDWRSLSNLVDLSAHIRSYNIKRLESVIEMIRKHGHLIRTSGSIDSYRGHDGNYDKMVELFDEPMSEFGMVRVSRWDDAEEEVIQSALFDIYDLLN